MQSNDNTFIIAMNEEKLNNKKKLLKYQHKLIKIGFKYGLIYFLEKNENYFMIFYDFFNLKFVKSSINSIDNNFIISLLTLFKYIISLDFSKIKDFNNSIKHYINIVIFSICFGIVVYFDENMFAYHDPLMNKYIIFNDLKYIENNNSDLIASIFKLINNHLNKIMIYEIDFPIRMFKDTEFIKHMEEKNHLIGNYYTEPIFPISKCDEKYPLWRLNLNYNLDYFTYFNCSDKLFDPDSKFYIVTIPKDVYFYHGSRQLRKLFDEKKWDGKSLVGKQANFAFLASYEIALDYVHGDKSSVFAFKTVSEVKLCNMVNFQNVKKILYEQSDPQIPNPFYINKYNLKDAFSYLFKIPAYLPSIELHNPFFNKIAKPYIIYKGNNRWHILIWKYLRKYLLKFKLDGAIIPMLRTSLLLNEVGTEEIVSFNPDKHFIRDIDNPYDATHFKK